MSYDKSKPVKEQLFNFYEGSEKDKFTKLTGQVMNHNPVLLAEAIENVLLNIVEINKRVDAITGNNPSPSPQPGPGGGGTPPPGSGSGGNTPSPQPSQPIIPHTPKDPKIPNITIPGTANIKNFDELNQVITNLIKDTATITIEVLTRLKALDKKGTAIKPADIGTGKVISEVEPDMGYYDPKANSGNDPPDALGLPSGQHLNIQTRPHQPGHSVPAPPNQNNQNP